MDHALLAAGEFEPYVNGLKLVPVVIVSVVWLRLMTWVDKDAPDARLPREAINGINLGGWVLGILVLLLPLPYAAGLGIFLFLFAAEVGYYLLWRKQKVGLGDLGDKFKEAMASFGRKPKEIKEVEGNVVLVDKGGKPFAPPSAEDSLRPAYDTLQELISTPMKFGAQRIDLRPTEGGSVQRYTVDGVTMEGKQFNKELAAGAIELAKHLAGMDIMDRRKPQTGKMKITSAKAKHELDVYSAGSTSGELLKLQVDQKKQFDRTVDTLGFLPDQKEQILNSIADGKGVVLLAAPDGHGLTNLCYAMMRKHDAFLSHMQTLEREPAVELEGITTTKLAPGSGASEEDKQVNWMISQQPDVMYIDKIEDPRSAIDLAKYAKDGKRVYIGMRVASTFDAVTLWRKLVGEDTLAMESLSMVIAERLVRVLCNACKVAYTPDPDALKKMNMKPDRVSKLYQPRKEPMRDPKGNEIVCTFCHGMAYQGRSGVFEIFTIDEEVRRAVIAGGNVNQLKALFRKQKQRYLQESALARVELGDTAVEEVLRVLRSGSSSSSRQKAAS